MSLIIELAQAPELASPHQIKLVLTSIFRSQMFLCKNMAESQKQIVFWLRPSQNAYNLSTSWRFGLTGDDLKIEVCIYNMNEDDLLRAFTDRMKIELFILLRVINNQIRHFFPTVSFLIDHQTGAIKLLDLLPQFCKFKPQKQFLQNTIFKLFEILRRYHEITTFLQPLYNLKQLAEEQLKSHPNNRINRLKCLLSSTPNRRALLNSSLFDLVQRRAANQQFTHEFMNVSNFYMMNALDFKLSQVGLEQVNYELDRNIFGAELDDKERHEKAKATPQSKLLDKILYGIVKIEPSKKITQQTKQENSEEQGAHSQINFKIFQYYIAETIYAGTVSYQIEQHQHQPHGKKKEGRLTYKVCNTESEASVNSFKNELAFLKHVRDMANPFVARYYLMVKEHWDERDTIYMTTYQQNVYTLITTRRTLSIKAKLQLSYKITKGLCFLFSKKISHRDFKPQNVVVDSLLTPKLIDFGSCVAHFTHNAAEKKFRPHDERLLSTPSYQIYYNTAVGKDPKIQLKLNKKQFDEHPLFDVYSLGKTLNFIFFGNLDLPNPESVANWPFPEIMQNIIFLISRCLNIDPDDRPSYGQITAFIGALNDLITKVMKIDEDQSQKTEDNPEISEEKKQQKQEKREKKEEKAKVQKKEKKDSQKLPKSRK